jgi:putative transposase
MHEVIGIATAHADVPLTRVSQVLGVGRTTIYRHQHARPPVAADVLLRDRIQQITLAMPAYGYRRSTAQLHRAGGGVNHKRVVRRRREDTLLGWRTRQVVRTTDSEHSLPVSPNLVPRLHLTGLNQVWIADITYVRLRAEFISLAVVLDAFSRRCIGWSLRRQVATRLSLAALRMAVAGREVAPGLVQHAERGVQYAAHA